MLCLCDFDVNIIELCILSPSHGITFCLLRTRTFEFRVFTTVAESDGLKFDSDS